MKSPLPSILRPLFPGRHAAFTFTRPHEALPAPLEPLNLYIHLPFCRRLCTFCPYLKQVHDPDVAAAYGGALLRELQAYRNIWGATPVRSVYFGGGTPSMTPELVETTLEWLARNFRLGGEVGVEVHPVDATPKILGRLRRAGVTMVSLGIQTFNDRLLALLGRGYDASRARTACAQVLGAGFETVDVDLIFALPEQSVREAVDDLVSACHLGADQVSSYPLICFGDTPLAAHLSAAGLRLPSWVMERRMLHALVSQAKDAGYQRTSIWSFNKPGANRYTTVTRETFVGIGAGASSRLGDLFQINTFDVSEYIKSTRTGNPAALSIRMNEGDRMAYWLFWRCYDTAIDGDRFKTVFGRDVPGGLRAAAQMLRALGMLRQDGSAIQLTNRGAYLFHLVEKQYTHSYLEPLWAACRLEAWPGSVQL